MTAGSRRTPLRRTARLGATVASMAIVAGLASVPADASAAPGAPSTLSPTSPSLGAGPLDHELAEAVKALKAAGADKIALQAAEAVKSSLGQMSTQDVVNKLSALSSQLGGTTVSAPTAARPVAAADTMSILKSLGIQPFSPSIAPLCTDPTADNPLGLVTAGAGAVPGPWPAKEEPMKVIDPLKPLLNLVPGIKLPEKLNLVEQGETAYAFVPASPDANGDGHMQVAWFNTNTLQGGFAELQPVDARARSVLPPLAGVRLAPVKTGSGTILSAIYGTSGNNGRTCYFLPAIGVVTAP
ncbi:hypothetical protein [Gordonia sp. NPDC003429]